MSNGYSFAKIIKNKYFQVFSYRRNGFEYRAVEADYDYMDKKETKREERKRKKEEYELEEYLGFKELTVTPM